MNRQWRFWPTRAERIQLNRSEEEIVALIARKKDLEFEVQKSQLALQNERQSFELERSKMRHDFNLETERLKEDLARTKRELSADFQLKEKELLTQTALKVKTIEDSASVNLEKAIQEKTRELQKQRESDLESMYAKLGEALSKLHTEGNNATKFLESIALKVLEQKPFAGNVDVTVGNKPPVMEITDGRTKGN